MSENSKIEWTDDTWNPIRARNPETGKVGWHCEKVSPACANCYAERQNRAGFAGGTRLAYDRQARNSVAMFLDQKTLIKPLHWRKPRRVFVCSMTDLFGEWVSDQWIDRILAVMALCERHAFQVLTKRPARMSQYLNDAECKWRVAEEFAELIGAVSVGDGLREWPLPNVWLGVTAEDQQRAGERLPCLCRCPAALRFVSVEPLLGPLRIHGRWSDHVYNWLDSNAGLRLVIAGGESGPKARPSHPDWFRSLRDQCVAAEVPFFFKQWGAWRPASQWDADQRSKLAFVDNRTGAVEHAASSFEPGAPCDQAPSECAMLRVGKKTAGRLLDGREWNEMPRLETYA